MFGTTAGKVIVMSAGGTMVAQVIIHEGLEITYLGWSSERFYLVDRDSDNQTNGDDTPFGENCMSALLIYFYLVPIARTVLLLRQLNRLRRN